MHGTLTETKKTALLKLCTKKNGYFDGNGKSVKNAFLKAPLQFKRIHSNFTTRRIHPILNPSGYGLCATQLCCWRLSAGIVTKAQSNGLSGNFSYHKNSNCYEIYYGHLSKYAKGIKKDVRVNQGKVIGYVGMTGFTTGAHLNFRIKYNDNFFDFRKIKQPTARTLTGEDKKEFKEKNTKSC